MKTKQIKPIKALMVVGADGLPNWSLHRLEIYGVKERAKENKGTFDKIIPVLITPIEQDKPKKLLGTSKMIIKNGKHVIQ